MLFSLLFFFSWIGGAAQNPHVKHPEFLLKVEELSAQIYEKHSLMITKANAELWGPKVQKALMFKKVHFENLHTTVDVRTWNYRKVLDDQFFLYGQVRFDGTGHEDDIYYGPYLTGAPFDFSKKQIQSLEKTSGGFYKQVRINFLNFHWPKLEISRLLAKDKATLGTYSYEEVEQMLLGCSDLYKSNDYTRVELGKGFSGEIVFHTVFYDEDLFNDFQKTGKMHIFISGIRFFPQYLSLPSLPSHKHAGLIRFINPPSVWVFGYAVNTYCPK